MAFARASKRIHAILMDDAYVYKDLIFYYAEVWYEVYHHPESIQDVDDPPPEICTRAVGQDGYALRFIKNPTEEVCWVALRSNCCAIQYVPNQTEAMCRYVVECDYYAIAFVRDQTFELCKSAILQSHRASSYIRTMTPELCELAKMTWKFALIEEDDTSAPVPARAEENK